jgi:phage-related protein
MMGTRGGSGGEMDMMSEPTYSFEGGTHRDKPLRWLHGQVRTPPFGAVARVQAGFLLRRLQMGERLGMPHSRPMPSIGSGCHELRIRDRSMQWRIVYRVDADALLILAVFQKTTPHTPPHVIDLCKRRIQHHDTNQPKE